MKLFIFGIAVVAVAVVAAQYVANHSEEIFDEGFYFCC